MKNLLDACHDRNLFAPWFKTEESWEAWHAFIAALFALPMSRRERDIYRKHTGLRSPPKTPQAEAWLVCGRRAGKSFILALIAVYLATFRDYRAFLQPGERGTVMVIAADRKQSRVIMRYVKALLHEVPMLARLVERETQETIDLQGRVTIEVHSVSFRRTRGYTIIAALLDEIAFWPTEDSASPDTEVIAALRPAMATIPGAMLLAASSPYARRGALWQAYDRYFGKRGSILVWQAATRDMNPSVPQSFIDAEYEKEPAHAAAEYGALFRTDVEALLTREAVQAVIERGRLELPFVPGTQYVAFVDPSGGSSDSFSLAIGHKEDGACVIDALRERKPPFSPEAVTKEFADLMRTYKISRVYGDRYAGEWPREQFRKRHIEYLIAPKPKSDMYLSLVSSVNGKQLALPDNPRLEAQLIGLERKTSRAGKDVIDHAPGGHDDLANAVAGAAHLILAKQDLAAMATFAPPIIVEGAVRPYIAQDPDPDDGRDYDDPGTDGLHPVEAKRKYIHGGVI